VSQKGGVSLEAAALAGVAALARQDRVRGLCLGVGMYAQFRDAFPCWVQLKHSQQNEKPKDHQR
jgi:hypothetical protein